MTDACADARVLHQRLVEQFAASAPAIHLVGFSLGALLASALASELKGANTPVASLSLLSFHPYGFAVRQKSSRWYSHWLIPEWYTPMIHPEQLPDPILVVHAKEDELEPVEDTRRFVESLKGRCRYVELSPGTHQSTIAPEGVRILRDFLATST